MKLDLNNFGKLKYKLVYSINNNNITNVLYIDKEHEERVITDGSICNNGYVLKVFKNNKSTSHNVIGLNKTRLELINKASKPIIYSYNNSEKIDESTYSVPFKVNNMDILMDFDKSVIIVYNESSNKCLVFGVDKFNVLNKDDLIESYIFTNNGFLYENYKTNEHSVVIDKYGTEIQYIFENSNNIICDILDKRPIYGCYDNNVAFSIEYDNNGLVNYCKISNNEYYKDKLLYRHEYAYDDYMPDNAQYDSLHPLIYDSFNPELISSPLKVWAIDELMVENGFKSFKREVYEIDSSKLDELVNILNDKSTNEPILL
jgi:hypothetical protein